MVAFSTPAAPALVHVRLLSVHASASDTAITVSSDVLAATDATVSSKIALLMVVGSMPVASNCMKATRVVSCVAVMDVPTTSVVALP